MACLCGTMPVELNAQRTTERAEMRASYMTLTNLSVPAVVEIDNHSVVHALRHRVQHSIELKHKDADWWMLNWENTRYKMKNGTLRLGW